MREPVLFAVLILSLATSSVLTTTCRRECDTRLSLDEEDFDVACNETCKIQKCYEGCDLWTEAISSTCHDVCEEETKVFKRKSSLYCVRGCNIAINMYIESIEETLGTPAAPYLVAETQTNTSISIAWTGSSLQNISYLVQLRLDGLSSSDWEYYQPFNLLTNTTLRVDHLQPYTKYKFRVAWILLENYSPLFSEESFVISTLAYGVPTTSPIITCITAVSCCRVSVSWNPPTQPNGPILSYVLYIKEHPTGNIMIKDVSDTSDGLHYMVNNLKPLTSYVISLSTRNTMGEGPADVRNVTTLPEKETSNLSYLPAYLIFAAKQRVLKQGLRILDESFVLYESLNKSLTVTGIALHVQENIFFVSDSEGSVYSVSFKKRHKVLTIFAKNGNYPSALSVDWLNGKLYMVEENQISRCDLNGNDYEAVVKDVKARPNDLHVDPINGYLFWVMKDSSTGGGLYRADLIEFNSSCISADKAELIINDSQIMTFAMDYKNFRLLLPSTANNTVMSVALDGSDVADIRENSQTPQYRNILSLAVHQNLLYWTTGKNIFGEEYHKRENKFYQNVYAVGDGPFLAMNVYHSDYQPHPVPLNPVESVEVLFGHDKAKIHWSSPRRLAGEGKGSYKKWLYEVNVFKDGKVLPSSASNISGNQYQLVGLKPSASYTVKLRAYSQGGKGPWSSAFHGSTLNRNDDPRFPIILWGAQDGLLQSNAIGEDVKLLIHKINLNNARVVDICAYEDLLFINTNTSSVYTLNTSIYNSLTRLHNISMASGIALDWFAPKLYWSSPVQQIISRSNLDGSQPEPLPILTMAREIAVDSMNAYLYYATSHSVERCRLNGRDHFVYIENALFSGKHVMGLTLDFERRQIYWMVRSYEGSMLFRACLAEGSGEGCTPLKPDVVGELNQDGLYGPFWYFSNRLHWLHENQRAIVSDIYGKNLAEINSPGLTELTSLAIIDPSLQPYPEGFSKDSIKVVPLSVLERSISIDGTSEQFNITWSPDDAVNFGTVFYEIRVDDGDEIYNLVTSETVFVYPTMKYISPYTSLTIAIQAFSFYASARQTIVNRHSPMSAPSKPLQPRVFITYKNSALLSKDDIVAIYRWLPPADTNGIIVSYRVVCWYIEDEIRLPVCDDVVDGKTLEFQTTYLLPNTTYYFQVSAATEAGEGPRSDIAEAETSVEKPVPQLLLANTDGLRVADIDSHEERLLYNKAVHPAAIAYLAQERRVFWMEEGALMVSSMDGTNTSQIKRLTSEGTCLTVDWVGRNLYWAEVNKKEGMSNIMSADLTHDSDPKNILNVSSQVTSLEVEPFSGSLIWTLESENRCNLMISDLSGANVRPFFARSLEYESLSNKLSKVKRMTSQNKTCNCIPSPSVGSAITIDATNSSHPQILFVDGMHGHIWSSDVDGCVCRLLFNTTENQQSGLPPTSLTADKFSIYWSNSTLGKVYSIPKQQKGTRSRTMEELRDSSGMNQVVTEDIHGIRSIRAIGDHLQPYPDPTCLLYESYQKHAELKHRSSTSLSLHLPPMHRPKECHKMSFPSDQYNVYYEPSGEDVSCFDDFNKRCKVINTYNRSVILQDLQPYTFYTIRISVKNFYSHGNPTLGPPVEYRTDEGAPSAPVNVSATIVSPYRIDVTWEPPILSNGPSVSYEVFWRVKGSSFSAVHSECGNHSSTDNLLMVIATTEAGEEHLITVRAYSSNCLLSRDSEEVTVTAFPLPHNLTLLSRSSTSLQLSWDSPSEDIVSNYILGYREADGLDWRLDARETPSPGGSTIFEIQGLVPKTKYGTQLILTYREKDVKFVWPRISAFEFTTAGDVPSAPGKPELKLMGRDIYEVFWYSSVNYGYEDLVYELQERSENSELHSEGWTTVFNSSNAEWIVEGISTNTNYEFRVRAFNEFGCSNYSYSEKPFILPETGAFIDPPEDHIGVVVASCIITALLLFLVLTSSYIIRKKKRKKNKKILAEVAASNQLVPDLELANLRDLPLHANFVHQTNALYNLSDMPSEEELFNLPQVHRDQIILTKFLGRGAFGEVYEGVVYDLNEQTPSLNIAIKTLKKGATEYEKEEFLKEAKLMSNFKHKHILQLLGVCFDSTLNFIILELMEGGDLLSFLRSNRPTIYHSSDMTMDDLMQICIDVAEGCKYLEDMHFVHRDLAARNCLVSSYNRDERIIKIGDFGLARDIYKNDYYRKEGEALLPVRWMAPESLIFGVFTNQSDIWAFGVLLWEVITLGQQPYQARSNQEVLNFVRAGGKLDKPENCPDDLFEVMDNCWSYDAEFRPTFCHCLHALKELRATLASSPVIMPAVYNFNYFGETNLGFDNLGYCGSELVEVPVPDSESLDDLPIAGTYLGQDEYPENAEEKLHDHYLDSRSTQSDPAAPTEMTEAVPLPRSSSLFDLPSSSVSSDFRAPRNREKPAAHKYLELLGDNEDADGYQLPLRCHKPHAPDVKSTSCHGRPKMNLPDSYMTPQPSPNLPLNATEVDSCRVETWNISNGQFPEGVGEEDGGDRSAEITTEAESYPSWLEDSDNWSVSTASTVTCHLDSSTARNREVPSVPIVDLKFAAETSVC